MLLPLLALAAVPFSYVILGDIFVRGDLDQIENIEIPAALMTVAPYIQEIPIVVNTLFLLGTLT